MLYTWQSGDVSKQEPYNGDFKAAMRAIKAKSLVLPGKTDLYFPYVIRFFPASLRLILQAHPPIFRLPAFHPPLRILTNPSPGPRIPKSKLQA